jgi:Methyltransferase domain
VVCWARSSGASWHMRLPRRTESPSTCSNCARTIKFWRSASATGALAAAAEVVTAGFLAGIDHSEVMRRIARSKNSRAVRCGHMELTVADSGHIPYPDRRFNKVLTMHTIYFWRDLKR